MGITIFKIFIWGGISSDIRSEISFTATRKSFVHSYPLSDMEAEILSSLIHLSVSDGQKTDSSKDVSLIGIL